MTHSHHEPTPLQSVAITADRLVKAPLGLLVSFLFSVIAGSIWATCVWRDVQDLKRDVVEIKAILHAANPSHAAISSSLSP